MTLVYHILYFIPVSVIILCLKYPIAITINEDDRVATSEASQTYLYYLIPSALFAVLYEAVKSFMISHKVLSLTLFLRFFPFLCTFRCLQQDCIFCGAKYL